jgi:hypothetical protein
VESPALWLATHERAAVERWAAQPSDPAPNPVRMFCQRHSIPYDAFDLRGSARLVRRQLHLLDQMEGRAP